MSCPCCLDRVNGVSCPCDVRGHPPRLSIAAGLTRLPRQIATFDDFRAAMLAATPSKLSLDAWRARDDDLGVMLLELWAYACDLLAFYDDVIAHEAYLRTARLDPSIRRLVGLLGYRPRPAIASRVVLAVAAEGRLAVDVRALAGARSGAFEAEPPQLFELAFPTSVHPLANQWQLEPPRRITAGYVGETHFSTLFLNPSTARLKEGELVLITVTDDASYTQLRRVTTRETVVAEDGETYVKVGFTTAVRLDGTDVSRVRMYRVNERIGLWSIAVTGNPAAIENLGSTPTLTLDGVYRQVRRNDTVLVSRDGEYRWFKVTNVVEQQLVVVAQKSITVNAADDDFDSTVTVPAIDAPATRITLDSSLNQAARGESLTGSTWSASDSARMLLHYGLSEVGRVVVPAESTVKRTDALRLRNPVEVPPDDWRPTRFLLVDKNGAAIDADGSLDYTTRALALTQTDEWADPLVLPVTVYGNVITLDRGETVAREVLGSGDASMPSQQFALKKSPLTHLPITSPDGAPFSTTLEVWVNDVEWTEVRSFFGAAPDAQCYIVRQDDEGKSHVVFGDGVRGRRLPTGVDNVRARYRFGAGAASPPANSVTQIAAPITGVKSWWNPQPAFGGDAAEPASKVRRLAPRSALVLGRAVSLADIEAVAASVGGTRAVRADWRWHEAQQRPVARIWYVGSAGVADLIADALRSVCDPSMPIDVELATARTAHLAIDVEVDERHDSDVVSTVILTRLLADQVGLLTPERVGISRPLVRSRLFAGVLEVDGARAVRGLLLDNVPMTQTAVSPGAGYYFDFEAGAVAVNGVSS